MTMREDGSLPAAHAETAPSEAPVTESQRRREAPHADLGFDLPAPRRLTRSGAVALGAGLCLALGALAFVGWLPKHRARSELVRGVSEAETALRRVEVVTPRTSSSDRAVVLPGSVRPLEETVVYPRANGYVRAWKVDIGDRVAQGDLLAEIDTPELDQQLEEARAEAEKTKAVLAQAEVNRELARVNFERYSALVPEGLAPASDLEDRKAQLQVAEASVRVAEAAVSASSAKIRQLAQIKAYARVTAPFAGTVSARSIERGSLVSPTTQLFTIAATETVRVFVGVPQNLAPAVRAGTEAGVTVREFPGRTFQGKVARTAGTLDPATRTLNTEVRVPNDARELLAGMYAQVSLNLHVEHRVLEVPATALLNDASGLRVAVVDAENRVRFRPVTIERDGGATLWLASGVEENERVVRVVNATLAEGQLVEPVQAPR